MAAEDDLALPQVPEAKADDPEDVSWSLSTAEAMWARGEHLEGIKWVRKAAEAASEVENDERALELAKAASELATIVARRSRASLTAGGPPGGGVEASAPPDPPSHPASGQPVSATPTTARSQPPERPSRPPPARSAPPIPLPSRSSQPPRSLSPMGGTVPPRSSSPMGMPAPPRSVSPSAVPAAPRPLATGDARQGPQAGRGILSNRSAPEKPKPRRRSRENLDTEARAAGVTETAPLRAMDSSSAERTLASQDAADSVRFSPEKPTANNGQIGPDSDHTIVARLEDLQPHRQKSVAEWDSSPTRNLTGEDLDSLAADGDRKTTAFAIPVAPPPAPAPMRSPQPTLHDPGIQTTQAVRVVVWRDANGVHVAPAGTVVSAITIDAVLVVLDEGADLTAWLSQRER